jgi:predicted dinucleotide-binding enzyme
MKLVQLGHTVMMGARSATNEKAAAWVQASGAGASQGTFADAAAFGEVVFNCTSGGAALEVLRQAGADNLKGKVLIDIANPLDFSHGMPPSLSVCNTDSLGEQIQRAFPQVRVVKSLNTVNCNLMVNAAQLPGDHIMFVSGNDADAKAQVTSILKDWFGWRAVIDLGDITTARATEMMLPIWISLMSKLGTPMFNFAIVK